MAMEGTLSLLLYNIVLIQAQIGISYSSLRGLSVDVVFECFVAWDKSFYIVSVDRKTGSNF
jgi:hypothetical protein